MKRTTEKVLGIIGIILDGFIVIGGFLLWSFVYFSDISIEPSSFPLTNFIAGVIYFLSYIVLFFAVISLICLILALFGLKKLKSNPKLSGYLFLIAAGISGLINIYIMVNISVFIPVQSIIYLIAGMLCLRDKPRLESGIKEEEI